MVYIPRSSFVQRSTGGSSPFCDRDIGDHLRAFTETQQALGEWQRKGLVAFPHQSRTVPWPFTTSSSNSTELLAVQCKLKLTGPLLLHQKPLCSLFPNEWFTDEERGRRVIMIVCMYIPIRTAYRPVFCPTYRTEESQAQGTINPLRAQFKAFIVSGLVLPIYLIPAL